MYHKKSGTTLVPLFLSGYFLVPSSAKQTQQHQEKVDEIEI